MSSRKGSLFSVFFVAALDNFGFGLVFVMFAPLILDSSYGLVSESVSQGMRNVILGLLFAAFPLTQFFGAPFLGDLADNLGRKKAFYLTILGTTVGYVLSALAIVAESLAFLFVSRLITGFFAGNLSICLASIADLSGDEKSRARNFGMVTVVWGFSWPVAMLAGGYLMDPAILPFFGPSVPFWLSSALSILSLLAIAFFFGETHEQKKIAIDFIWGVKNCKLSP